MISLRKVKREGASGARKFLSFIPMLWWQLNSKISWDSTNANLFKTYKFCAVSPISPGSPLLQYCQDNLHVRKQKIQIMISSKTSIHGNALFSVKLVCRIFSPKHGIFYISRNLDAPTLFWIRNLKGRNIRPYPIKLWRSCMHREKSGHVISNYDVIWTKQK